MHECCGSCAQKLVDSHHHLLEEALDISQDDTDTADHDFELHNIFVSTVLCVVNFE
jgi:hypothetical protein